MIALPPMPDDFEPTRATLHAYALAVDAVPRIHAVAHPKWWHISLNVGATGLTTDPIPLPAGGTVQLRIDLVEHAVVVETSTGRVEAFPMTEGRTGSDMADSVLAVVAGLGLEGDYDRTKFESDEARRYDPDVADRYNQILGAVDQVFRARRARLEGTVSPIQLWPHNFDLAFEWFGTRTESAEENGETKSYPAQLNLGFYVAGRPYFYSNPWPFEKETLTEHALPAGASWFDEGWEGSILYYDQVAGRPDAADLVLEYAHAVFDLASPTLTA